MIGRELTSIIVVGYHATPLSAHITMACLANIIRFTDRQDYELILIEDVPQYEVRDDYHIFEPYKHIVLPERTNYAAKMNLAAKNSKGDYLAFIQNDCFVWEGWLTGLRYYLERGLADVIVPDQTPRDRVYIKTAWTLTMEEGLKQGNRDACMLMMTKEAYQKTGGFNEDLEAFVEADFYERCGREAVNIQPTNKVVVTHLTLATHYQNKEEFEKAMNHDSLIRNKK